MRKYWMVVVMVLLGGCATVELDRGADNLTLKYSSFLKKLEAPSVEVNKVGDYSASANAESSAADPVAAMMVEMIPRLLCASNPAMCAP